MSSRRNFLKTVGLTGLPALASAPLFGMGEITEAPSQNEKPEINFISDGLLLSPSEYIQIFSEVNKTNTIKQDFYGAGGSTKLLEEAYASLTGKEKAIFLPTGTMANQLAIKLLSAENTKVLVPENSHVYRDEADSAQSVHNKRLIPVGKDKPFYTLADLEETMKYYDDSEVFKSGWGAVVIENPVRRANGSFVPIDVIKEISKACREKGLKLHLDGARVHIASAYSSISLNEYSGYFDTVYISLYKYLNAPHGAMLCGDAALIDKITHQIKILGGAIFQTWTGTSIALHYLDGIDERWKNVALEMEALVAALNKLADIKISKIQYGTNIYNMVLNEKIDHKKFSDSLYKNHNIIFGRRGPDGTIPFTANATLLRSKTDVIVDAFKQSIANAKG